MCCHICSGSTVSKGPEDRPKKISHWPQCHSARLFCCRCATSANKNVVTRSGRCAGIHNLSFHSTGWLQPGRHLTCLPTTTRRRLDSLPDSDRPPAHRPPPPLPLSLSLSLALPPAYAVTARNFWSLSLSRLGSLFASKTSRRHETYFRPSRFPPKCAAGKV